MPRDIRDEEERSEDARQLEIPDEKSEPRPLSPDVVSEMLAPEAITEMEEYKLESGAQRLRQIDELQPERWSQLDGYERRVTLDRAGQVLGEVYEYLPPPVLGSDFADESTRGIYDDERWLMFLKGHGEFDLEKLGDDDPELALHTYAHEFRHSYQWKEASLYDSPQFFKHMAVDDPDRAREWADNLPPNYIPPPSPEMAKEDPARYHEQFRRYKNQPLERDADLFADELVQRVFRKS